MSTTTAPRSAVTVAYGLATALLVGSLAFVVLVHVSIGVGLVRGGASLFYGDTLRVPMQISAEDLGPVPPPLDLTSWPDVTVKIGHPTVGQMLLQSARDVGPLVGAAGR